MVDNDTLSVRRFSATACLQFIQLSVVVLLLLGVDGLTGRAAETARSIGRLADPHHTRSASLFSDASPLLVTECDNSCGPYHDHWRRMLYTNHFSSLVDQPFEKGFQRVPFQQGFTDHDAVQNVFFRRVRDESPIICLLCHPKLF